MTSRIPRRPGQSTLQRATEGDGTQAGLPPASAATPRFGCTCGRLRKLTRRLTRIYDGHLAGAGMNVNQYAVLAHIAEAERALTQLADALEMDRTTLTRNLRPLADAGWVAMVAGADARSRVARLTRSGKAALARARTAWAAAQLEIESLLGETWVRDMHRQVASAMSTLRHNTEPSP